MKFDLNFTLDTTDVAKIERFQKRSPEAMKVSLVMGLNLIRARVVKTKLLGQVLQRQTGNLIRTIQEGGGVSMLPDRVRLTAGSSAEYAPIHEFGGTIRHPGGTAYYYNAKLGRAVFISNRLAQIWDAQWAVPVPRTRPHDIPIPKRPFLRPSVEEEMPTIIKLIRANLADLARRLGIPVK